MYLTHHAKQRIVERVGIPRKAAQRYARLAMERGYELSEIKGPLVFWVRNRLYDSEGEELRPPVYGDKLFLFTEEYTLITVLQIPSGILRDSVDRYIIGKSAVKRPRFQEEDWMDEMEELEEEEFEDSFSFSLH